MQAPYPDFITDTPQARAEEVVQFKRHIKAAEDAEERRTPEAQKALARHLAFADAASRPLSERLRTPCWTHPVIDDGTRSADNIPF